MMNEITIRQNMMQEAAFSENRFMDFVTWLDRPEKTTRTYLTNLRQFAAWLRYTGIIQPTRSDIIDYKDWLSSEHDAIQLTGEGWSYRTDNSGNCIRITCSANTTAQYLRVVQQFFKWLSSNGLYPDIAANIHPPKLRNDVHRKLALTPEQVTTIESSIHDQAEAKSIKAASERKDTVGRIQRSDEQGKRLAAIYMLAVNVGLRTVEISRANVRDFTTIDGRSWIYIHGKGHAEADTRKPLADPVADAVRDYLNSRMDDYSGNSPLFVATGNRSGGKRLATTTISTMLKKAMQEAGYDDPRITAHSLRHTAGNSVMDVTSDNVYKAQKYMRHSSPRTTEIYLHRDDEKADAEIADDLYSYYHGHDQEPEDAASILSGLSPEQLQAVLNMAKAMTA